MLNPEKSKARALAGSIHNDGQRRRWTLQRFAAGIMADKVERIGKDGQCRPHFVYRVAMCHRGTDGGAPAIKRSADRINARYTGLQTCASVWHCPICAPKVAQVRKAEMNEAIQAHKKAGGEVYFATYTRQHDAESGGAGSLPDALKGLSKALSGVKGNRGYREAMAAAGSIGAIRGFEVTYGEINGWHPHAHELIFAAPGNLAQLRRSIRSQWCRLLVRRGLAGLKLGDIGRDRFRKLRDLYRRAFTLQAGDYAAEYVAKFGREPEGERGSWGIASEITRSHLKRGRGPLDGAPQRCAHASPWALLNDALDGDQRSRVLWREYAEAMQGKRQLFWSRGLRVHFFGIAERTDDDIAAAADSRCTEHVCELGPIEWQTVIAHDARFDVLRIAALSGAAAVHDYIEKLGESPPTHSGNYQESSAIFLMRRAA